MGPKGPAPHSIWGPLGCRQPAVWTIRPAKHGVGRLGEEGINLNRKITVWTPLLWSKAGPPEGGGLSMLWKPWWTPRDQVASPNMPGGT